MPTFISQPSMVLQYVMILMIKPISDLLVTNPVPVQDFPVTPDIILPTAVVYPALCYFPFSLWR